MAHPPIVIVDENDKVIGSAPMPEAWGKGLIHRIVRIMVEDEAGRILLQKRSGHVELFPDCWDHSAAGHVDEGETYESAARRELEEELGIFTSAPLIELATFRTDHTFNGRRLNRFNKLYKVAVPDEQKFAVDEHEVSEARWFTLGEIKQLIAEHPEQTTDGLQHVMRDYYQE